MSDDRSDTPGRPWDEPDRPDRRPRPSIRDLVAVKSQTSRVGSEVQTTDWQRDLLKRLAGRRDDVGDEFVRGPLQQRFSVHESEWTGKTILTVLDRVLVLTADLLSEQAYRPRPMRVVLSRYQYESRLADAADGAIAGDADEQTPFDGQGFLQGRVTVLTFAGLDPDGLAEVVELLHDNGFAASLDHVVPLHNGVIIKDNSAIRLTERRVKFDPAPDVVPVVVALVDTGIETRQRVDGWLQGIETDENADPLDVFPLPAGHDGLLDLGAGHGTFVAGIVAQLAPGATLRMYRAIDSDGIGSEVDVAIAMVRAAWEGADIINLSLGTETLDDHPPVALAVAMQLLFECFPHVVVVAAAGNSGSRELCWPSAFPGVVSVAALDADLTRAPWSNTGPWVDFCTVGQGVLSTFVPGIEAPETTGGPVGDSFPPDQPWGIGTGTSFAAPQVAGILAELVQRGRCRTVRQAVAYLRSLARDRHDGYGVPLDLLPGTSP